MIFLKQSTASQEIPLGYFVDSLDGNTEETALTINNTDIKIWKNGATTLANKNSGGATHISNGIYYAVLDATDTDTVGPMVIFVHVTGALTVRLECCVLAANVFDSIVAGSASLAVNTAQIAGSNVSTSTAQIGVNVVNAAGTAWGSGAITSGVFASGAITAAAIATDAIGAAELATDAVTEIAAGVWSASVPAAFGAGTSGYLIGTNLDATVSSRSTLTAAAVNTEVVDALNVDTYAEPGSGAPGTTITLAQKIGYLYKAFRNKVTQTATEYTLYADDESTAHQKATVSDDGTTFTRGEVGGP